MHALVSNSPLLTVAAAVAALIISRLVIAMARVLYATFALVLRALAVQVTIRLMLGLSTILALLLVFNEILRR